MRNGANNACREIRLRRGRSRPSGFARSLGRSHAQDDRGGCAAFFLFAIIVKQTLYRSSLSRIASDPTKIFAVEAHRAKEIYERLLIAFPND